MTIGYIVEDYIDDKEMQFEERESCHDQIHQEKTVLSSLRLKGQPSTSEFDRYQIAVSILLKNDNYPSNMVDEVVRAALEAHLGG